MIHPCTPSDFDTILTIINDAAAAYKGVIPADRWHEPYMSAEYLRGEIDAGVVFYGYEQEPEKLLGIMGIQDVQDVTLIRHAYVRTVCRGRGIGSKLLAHLRTLSDRPILIGTWADASWAIRFYQGHAFRVVTPKEKDMLLRRYWSIPDRQVATSVVLVDERYASTRTTAVEK